MILLILHVVETRALDLSPVAALVKSVPVLTCAQVLQRCLPHWWLLSYVIFSHSHIDTLTKKSFRLLGHR